MPVHVCPLCGRPSSSEDCPHCPAEETVTEIELLPRGSKFRGLEIVGRLGRGGMGEVYQARQSSLDRFVAVKILDPDHAWVDELGIRFEREAKAMAALSHPNIVPVFEYGQEGDLFFICMEFMEGGSLRSRMGRMTFDEKIRVLRELLEALEFAHSRGIVHRDIKPENILLDGSDRARISDFGLAKLRAPETEILTRTTAAFGTPGYMAPEQMAGAGSVDARADLYSAGIVAYEMITGSRPVGNFDPPSTRGDCPEALDAVILRALAQDPARRFSSAREFRDALIAAAGERRRSALPWVVLFLVIATAAVTPLAVWKEDGKPIVAPADPPISAAYALERELPGAGGPHRLATTASATDVFTAGHASVIRRFRIADGEALASLQLGAPTRAIALSLSPDGLRLVSGADDKKVRMHRLDGSADPDWVGAGHDGAVTAVAFRRDGARVASGGDDRKILLRDSATGEVLREIPRLDEAVTALSWSPDGRLASALADRTVRLWNADTGEELRRLPHPDDLYELEFSRDGSLLAVGGGNRIRLWRTADWTFTELECAQVVQSISIRGDGRVLASGHAGGGVTLWNLRAATRVLGLREHVKEVTSLTFTPDGERLVTSSYETLVWKREP